MRKKLCFVLLTFALVLFVSCRVSGNLFYRVLTSHEAQGHNDKNYGGGLSIGEVTFHDEEGEYRIKVVDREGAASDFSYSPKRNLLYDGYRTECLRVWSQLRRAEALRLLREIPVEEVFVSYDFAEYGFIATPSKGQIFVSVMLEEQYEKETFSLLVLQTVQNLQSLSGLADVNVCAAYRDSFLQYSYRSETGRITLSKIGKATKVTSKLPFPKP